MFFLRTGKIPSFDRWDLGPQDFRNWLDTSAAWCWRSAASINRPQNSMDFTIETYGFWVFSWRNLRRRGPWYWTIPILIDVAQGPRGTQLGKQRNGPKIEAWQIIDRGVMDLACHPSILRFWRQLHVPTVRGLFGYIGFAVHHTQNVNWFLTKYVNAILVFFSNFKILEGLENSKHLLISSNSEAAQGNESQLPDDQMFVMASTTTTWT